MELSGLDALLHPSCHALSSGTTTATISSFLRAVIEYCKAAGSSFFRPIWDLLKACRHALDEECFAIEEQVGVSRFVPYKCPDNITIYAVGLVVPRWFHEWAHLILVGAVWGMFLWFDIELSAVMPGRRQEIVNAVNGVVIGDLDLEE